MISNSVNTGPCCRIERYFVNVRGEVEMADVTPLHEERYFIEQEVKRLKQIHQERMTKQAEAERARLKELHFMHCAKCGEQMETTTLVEVEIEVCPDCGGIYLAAGELHKIVNEQKRGPFANALALARSLWLAP